MRIALNVLGALCLLVGCVWILQGINILPGSFMTGRIEWAVYGATLGVVGVIFLILANRGRGRASRRQSEEPEDDTPRNVERFRALRDVVVQVWAEQGESGHTVSSAVFPRGRMLEIEERPKDRTSCLAEPLDYEELEPVLVPAADRQMPKYCGIYLLVVETQQLSEDFEPVAA